MDKNSINEQAQFDYKRLLLDFCSNGREASQTEEAILFAQAVELQLLKSPQSAVFPTADQFKISESDGVYRISAYVDSQNSYGASVRTPFIVNVKKENGEWSSVDKFISTEKTVAGSVLSHSVIYWILGIIGTLITYGVIRVLIDL